MQTVLVCKFDFFFDKDKKGKFGTQQCVKLIAGEVVISAPCPASTSMCMRTGTVHENRA
jgi:hypothetical protein